MTDISISGRAAIAGLGATEFSKNSGRTELRLAMEATLAALADAGIDPSEVEGFSSYTMDKVPEYEIARLLGCRNVKFFSTVPHGGGAACAPILHAAMTVATGAAKAGVLSLASSLAVEWAPRVRVLAISPGLVQTEQSHLHYGDDAGVAAVGATIPAGRMAKPQDIADACVYAGSPMAAYFAGTNLLLHGGGERPAFLAAANTGT